MADPELETFLNDFVSPDARKQHAVFRELLALKKHHAAMESAKFREGLEGLLASASSGAPADRLVAVATIGRITSVARRLRSEIEAPMVRALTEPLAPVGVLSDPDDRRYVAEACRSADHPWVVGYAADAVVLEESGEEARQAFVAALLTAAPNISQAIDAVAHSIRTWHPATESPADSAARRLRRICKAFRMELREGTFDTGEDPGASVAELARAAFKNAAGAVDLDVGSETVNELCGMVHELVRQRFSLATAAGTFDALRVATTWFVNAGWQRSVVRSKNAAAIASDIREAILILSRQGIADLRLREQLVIARGSRDSALADLRDLAAQKGIPDDVRAWLATGTSTTGRAPTTGAPARLHDDDERIADLLIDAMRFRSSDASCRKDVIPELQILLPAAAKHLERTLNFGLGVCDELERLGASRRLRVRGEIGGEEEYSPLDHDSTEPVIGARRVRLIRPAVEQLREDGTPFVIRKAFVQAIY